MDRRGRLGWRQAHPECPVARRRRRPGLGHGRGGLRGAGSGVRAARGPLELRGLGVRRAGLGAVAREAAQRLGAATYSARKWLAAHRPVYRWKRLGAGYKASAAGAGGCRSGPLDSGTAALFSQIHDRPQKLDLPNSFEIDPITSYTAKSDPTTGLRCRGRAAARHSCASALGTPALHPALIDVTDQRQRRAAAARLPSQRERRNSVAKALLPIDFG